MRAGRALLPLAFVVVLAAGTPATAQDEAVEISYEIDGAPLAEADATNPARLVPRTVSTIDVTVTNTGAQPVTISSARFRGEMLGMTFVSYDTIVLIDVPAGESRAFRVPIDLYDLDNQATGYLRAEISLLDSDRNEISAQTFAIDVRGRMLSSMGVFALVVLVVAALSIGVNVWSLVRRSLPENRFLRGTRLAISGLALGLLLATSFSILRIFPLPTAGWAPLVLIPTIAGFVFGYLLPAAFLGDVELSDP